MAPTIFEEINFACPKIRWIHERNIISTEFFDLTCPNAISSTIAGYHDAFTVSRAYAKLSFNMAGKQIVKLKFYYKAL